MSFWDAICDGGKIKVVSIITKQTDVSAEFEDSIQFEDKYGNFIINDSTVNIYQY